MGNDRLLAEGYEESLRDITEYRKKYNNGRSFSRRRFKEFVKYWEDDEGVIIPVTSGDLEKSRRNKISTNKDLDDLVHNGA